MPKLISAETLDNLINHMINLYDCKAVPLGDKLYEVLKDAFADGRLDEWQFQLVANTRNTMLQKDLDLSLVQQLDLDPDDGWITSNMPVICIHPDQVPTLKGMLADSNLKTGVCIYS
jgi:hypothetical protein